MAQPLEGFYERELLFLEETAHAFAERYPANAKHLVPETGRSIDPHLERLVEGLALLAGRVRHKIDSEFPELTESLLQVLYPHLNLIIPSMAIAQATPPTGTGAHRAGVRLAQGTVARSQRFGRHATALQYQVGYPVAVWPIELVKASWETSPFHLTLKPPPNSTAVLRMHFACKDGFRWDELSLDRLRLYLTGDRQFVAALYEILFNRCVGVAFQAPNMGAEADTSRPPVRLAADQCLSQVGFNLEEGLLPFPPESFPGYRLLMELLSFPQKYFFADIAGWNQIRGRGFGSQVEVLLFFSRSQENLEHGISAQNFLLGCTPVVNLFQKSVEPIDVDHKKSEYRVVPERRQPGSMEVYRIESVRSLDSETGQFQSFLPFYASPFGRTAERPAFFHTVRRDSVVESVPGTEVNISLVDLGFHPNQRSNRVLDIQAWCTNRDLAFKYQTAGDRLQAFGPETEEPWGLTLLHKPTPALRPPLRRGTYWRLMGQNCLNHVSLIHGSEGFKALQELLRLCDFSGPATPQLAAVNQQIIDGLKSIRSKPTLVPVHSSSARMGMCRGMETILEFDEEKYTGTGVFLVASVLERFFGLYTSVNSFSSLIAKVTQAEGYLKKWPPRAGAERLP